MRPALHGDLVAAACALLAVPRAARADLLAALIAEAELADAHRLATGRAHPRFGTGSLMSAALARPHLPEPRLAQPDYAACLIQVLAALAARG